MSVLVLCSIACAHINYIFYIQNKLRFIFSLCFKRFLRQAYFYSYSLVIQLRQFYLPSRGLKSQQSEKHKNEKNSSGQLQIHLGLVLSQWGQTSEQGLALRLKCLDTQLSESINQNSISLLSSTNKWIIVQHTDSFSVELLSAHYLSKLILKRKH